MQHCFPVEPNRDGAKSLELSSRNNPDGKEPPYCSPVIKPCRGCAARPAWFQISSLLQTQQFFYATAKWTFPLDFSISESSLPLFFTYLFLFLCSLSQVMAPVSVRGPSEEEDWAVFLSLSSSLLSILIVKIRKQ